MVLFFGMECLPSPLPPLICNNWALNLGNFFNDLWHANVVSCGQSIGVKSKPFMIRPRLPERRNISVFSRFWLRTSGKIYTYLHI